MAKHMLIDAAHAEEMRVVVADGTRIDDFDIESAAKKQIKGNIYLAKISRIEPSLQAAFVEYGGNRHGFLSFAEINPDYYQIPAADKEELKRAIEAEYEASHKDRPAPRKDREDEAKSDAEAGSEEETVESDAADDELDDEKARLSQARLKHLKEYKIQDVLRRGQVLLVQVVKEERGNKGAAITTYLSLAGRYCVLMPNNVKGGGVSRKIASGQDRKRLKDILDELPVPQGMSVIVRTAGRERTKVEIKRDYDYLIKTWIAVRDKTLESKAPCLIHEEGNLIKRAMRDIYGKDIGEIIIAGEDAYNEAKELLKLLSPAGVKHLQLYKDTSLPLFQRYRLDDALEALENPVVPLKSGGYLVINQTEALVAIDVNSGKSIKEMDIEDTALKTNIEAAEEIARQLRLRDLAGLVVVDFIDMEEHRHNHQVERKMKDCMRRDRAKVQVGRISGFGLMEISRQRINSSVIETSYCQCPFCNGSGVVKRLETAALHIMRMIEEEASTRKYATISVSLSQDTALFILNSKRDWLTDLGRRFDVQVVVTIDPSMRLAGDNKFEFTPIPKAERKARRAKEDDHKHRDSPQDEESDADGEPEAEDDDAAEEGADAPADGDNARRSRSGFLRKRGRGRTRRGSRRDPSEARPESDGPAAEIESAPETATQADAESAPEPATEETKPPKEKRRGWWRKTPKEDAASE